VEAKLENNRNTPLFGVSIDPAAADVHGAFSRAEIADTHGLDIITIMDHPYNMKLFDTWTLLTAIGQATKRVQLATNVLSLPLRPPAMLAKQAATLDLLTEGRMALGLGAGAYWDGISAFGGPRRTPGEAYQAFEDALHIIRGMWDNSGQSFTYEGEIYQVKGIMPGPAPAHRIPLWVGARGPRMLRLLGRMGDGLFISYNYDQPEILSSVNEHIDHGAFHAGRDLTDIRRGYNLMGVIDLGREDTKVVNSNGKYLNGDIQYWIERILNWHQEYRQDTFIFWPIGENALVQIEAFAQTIAPAVKEALAE
jgi:alkanesulfonate monooxygenase SsuD/methylene tetrahydromethanopterin reductase-like flavin-dependent oxidoreductase (luciferase family)